MESREEITKQKIILERELRRNTELLDEQGALKALNGELELEIANKEAGLRNNQDAEELEKQKA